MYATSGCEGIPARTEPGKEPYSPLETAWDVVDVFGTPSKRAQQGRLGPFAVFVVCMLDVKVLNPIMMQGGKGGHEFITAYDYLE